MNERIEDIALSIDPEAWRQCHADDVEWCTKFAELIIKECAKVAWHNTPETEELEYSHMIKDKILEHFGVEE
jgi:hypothetical protein